MTDNNWLDGREVCVGQTYVIYKETAYLVDIMAGKQGYYYYCAHENHGTLFIPAFHGALPHWHNNQTKTRIVKQNAKAPYVWDKDVWKNASTSGLLPLKLPTYGG